MPGLGEIYTVTWRPCSVSPKMAVKFHPLGTGPFKSEVVFCLAGAI